MKTKIEFSRIARWTSSLAGQPATFLSAAAIILAWAVSGPWFGYSDTWQLVINTGTTIITFLMVFLIQNSQNRDTILIHLKLDELVRAIKEARNSVIDLEELDEIQLHELLQQYKALAGRDRVSAAEPASARIN